MNRILFGGFGNIRGSFGDCLSGLLEGHLWVLCRFGSITGHGGVYCSHRRSAFAFTHRTHEEAVRNLPDIVVYTETVTHCSAGIMLWYIRY